MTDQLDIVFEESRFNFTSAKGALPDPLQMTAGLYNSIISPLSATSKKFTSRVKSAIDAQSFKEAMHLVDGYLTDIDKAAQKACDYAIKEHRRYHKEISKFRMKTANEIQLYQRRVEDPKDNFSLMMYTNINVTSRVPEIGRYLRWLEQFEIVDTIGTKAFNQERFDELVEEAKDKAPGILRTSLINGRNADIKTVSDDSFNDTLLAYFFPTKTREKVHCGVVLMNQLAFDFKLLNREYDHLDVNAYYDMIDTIATTISKVVTKIRKKLADVMGETNVAIKVGMLLKLIDAVHILAGLAITSINSVAQFAVYQISAFMEYYYTVHLIFNRAQSKNKSLLDHLLD